MFVTIDPMPRSAQPFSSRYRSFFERLLAA
jgi:hypothetical protein